MHFADFYYAGLTNINLHLSLVDVHTFTSEQSDPTYANGTTNGVLDLFLNYHWENLQNFPNHDNAILLIVRNFTENAGTVGLAYIGVQCDMWGSGILFFKSSFKKGGSKGFPVNRKCIIQLRNCLIWDLYDLTFFPHNKSWIKQDGSYIRAKPCLFRLHLKVN